MASNHHSEFYELGDVTPSIACSISVVNGDGDKDLSGVEVVLLYEASVDCAADAAAIKQALSH